MKCKPGDIVQEFSSLNGRKHHIIIEKCPVPKSGFYKDYYNVYCLETNKFWDGIPIFGMDETPMNNFFYIKVA